MFWKIFATLIILFLIIVVINFVPRFSSSLSLKAIMWTGGIIGIIIIWKVNNNPKSQYRKSILKWH
jgi:hypothetical protein